MHSCISVNETFETLKLKLADRSQFRIQEGCADKVACSEVTYTGFLFVNLLMREESEPKIPVNAAQTKSKWKELIESSYRS